MPGAVHAALLFRPRCAVATSGPRPLIAMGMHPNAAKGWFGRVAVLVHVAVLVVSAIQEAVAGARAANSPR
jgi:hypothetical protein